MSAGPLPNNVIVVQNAIPASWSGRMFDVSLYKSDRVLLTQKDVHVGDQVVMELRPILYFGIACMSGGDVFTSLETTSSLTEFDLSNYPNGLVVTLTQQPGVGLYTFTGTAMEG